MLLQRLKKKKKLQEQLFFFFFALIRSWTLSEGIGVGNCDDGHFSCVFLAPDDRDVLGHPRTVFYEKYCHPANVCFPSTKSPEHPG